jgi:hypothetical protein
VGPQSNGLIIFVSGDLPWVAAIALAFAAGALLLIWKRTRKREEAGPERKAVECIGVPVIENHVPPIPAGNTAKPVVEEKEGNSDSGCVLDELASEEAVSRPVASEDSGILSGESAEAVASDLPVVEKFRGPGVEAAILSPAIEAVPALAVIEPREESNPDNSRILPIDPGEVITATIAEIALAREEVPSGRPDNGDSIVAAEAVDETLIAGGDKQVEQEVQTEEEDEPAEAREPAGGDEAEELGDEQETVGVETGKALGNETTPARYRAPVLGPGNTQRRKSARSGAGNQEQVLELRVRAVSDRHGFCRFQIVGRQPAGGPADLEAQSGRRTIALSEVADDWYEIAGLTDLPVVMERGVRFSASADDGGETNWALRGRDLYVLAGLQGIFGFVSTTRLSIGEEQIVLCRESRALEVQTILAEAGCDGARGHGRDDGAPSGWVFFKPVNPSRSVQQVPGDDVLNLIRPIPDIEVKLEGGLWLRDSSWIAGFPPKIHIAGDLPLGTEVMIDGEAADEHEPRVYVTGGSDRPGSHAVWCAGKSASYEICEPDVCRDEWKEDGFSRRLNGAAIVGAGNAHEIVTSVPTANPVLIGANPGEVFKCDKRPGRQWTGLVPFAVSWALPEDALHCDRRLRRVLMVNQIAPVHSVVWRYRRKSASASILQWCHAIRDCQRKGLALSPADEARERLWREYKREARAVWRAAR